MHLGQGLGARPEVEGVAVAQTVGVEGAFLVQRFAAEPLEHPAAVVESGFFEVVARVAEHGGEQVRHGDVGGHGEIDASGWSSYRQTAQLGHLSVSHRDGSRFSGYG